MSGSVPQPPEKKKSFATLAWVNSTYFAEGLPFMLVRVVSTIYFTKIGANVKDIGYLNWLGFAWNFKFLWAPFLDSIGTKRRWMIGLQFLVGLLTAAIAATCLTVPSDGDPTGHLRAIALIFVALAFVSATNDVAIDAYYME